MQFPPIITIDGPSGSGKSVLTKIIANNLKWSILESGMIYRILACLFLKKKNFLPRRNFSPFLLKMLDNYFVYNNNIISKINYKGFSYQYIHSQKVTNTASKLATIEYIRKELLIKQRLFRTFPGLIAEGRDMGTSVFPDATIKFFLKAKLKHRVYRRMKEFKRKNIKISFKKLLSQMIVRDHRDKNRQYNPLIPAKNAIILDSSNMNLMELVQLSMKYINKIIKKKNFSIL